MRPLVWKTDGIVIQYSPALGAVDQEVKLRFAVKYLIFQVAIFLVSVHRLLEMTKRKQQFVVLSASKIGYI